MKIAVSGCLNGENCRYDGKAKKDNFITEILPKYAEVVHFCPEDKTFGTPRESIRFIEIDGKKKVFGNKSKEDLTDQLKIECIKTVEKLSVEDISGFILKSKSPTCGLERVRVYNSSGTPLPSSGVGVLAETIKEQLPFIPVEEEGRIQDSWLKENFIMQLYAFDNFKRLKKEAKKFGELVQFHTEYKFLLQSRDDKLYRELGNIVANGKTSLFNALESYEQIFLKAISKKSSIGKTANVLEHLYGFVKKYVDDSEKSSFLNSLKDFREEIIPLIVPISLIKLYADKYEVKYLQNQKFLDPYPKELALRSSIKAVK